MAFHTKVANPTGSLFCSLGRVKLQNEDPRSNSFLEESVTNNEIKDYFILILRFPIAFFQLNNSIKNNFYNNSMQV